MNQYKKLKSSLAQLAFLLIFILPHGVLAGKGGWVDDCQPCKLSISSNENPYLFTFNFAAEEDSTVVKSISVSSSTTKKPSQTLTVDFMTPVFKGEQFYLEAEDINFDGYNDLLFQVSMGTANSYAKYWLFNPTTKNFDYLDEFPTFKIDAKTKSLTTYERGGHGGMIFESKSYGFINKKLVVVKSESQEWVEDKRIYLNTVKSLKNGVLTLDKTTKVPPPKSPSQ